jgi:hypothetical protein
MTSSRDRTLTVVQKVGAPAAFKRYKEFAMGFLLPGKKDDG